MTDSVSRTVRFKKDEADLIDRFLESNAFLDFSTLSRIAIMQFIRDPRLQLRPIQAELGSSNDTQREGRQ